MRLRSEKQLKVICKYLHEEFCNRYAMPVMTTNPLAVTKAPQIAPWNRMRSGNTSNVRTTPDITIPFKQVLEEKPNTRTRQNIIDLEFLDLMRHTWRKYVYVILQKYTNLHLTKVIFEK